MNSLSFSDLIHLMKNVINVYARRGQTFNLHKKQNFDFADYRSGLQAKCRLTNRPLDDGQSTGWRFNGGHSVFMDHFNQQLLMLESVPWSLSLGKLPCDFEVRGHCMCKEMPVILVNRVVDKKRIIGIMEGRGGGEAQGVADPKECPLRLCCSGIVSACSHLPRTNW
jgi:hypothetical protein